MPLRDQYLNHPDVAEFAEWFSAQLTSGQVIQHYQTAGGVNCVFHGLPDALAQYDWTFRVVYPGTTDAINGRTFGDNSGALEMLQARSRPILWMTV